MNRFDDDHEEEEEEEENDVLLMMIMMRIFCSSSVRKEAVLQEEIVEKFLFVYSGLDDSEHLVTRIRKVSNNLLSSCV
jgi:hypothetical protein